MAEIIDLMGQDPRRAEEKTAPLEKCRELSCFANENGFCRALGDTDFGMRRCPFYKTKEDALTDQLDALQRLVDKGRFDLIEKYRGTLETLGILESGDSFFYEHGADIDYLRRLRELEMQLKEEKKEPQDVDADSIDGLAGLFEDEWDDEDDCEGSCEEDCGNGCEDPGGDSCRNAGLNEEGGPDGRL